MADNSSAALGTPVHDRTVFISYARADDEQPPYDDTTQGWVKFFWSQLRWELTDRGAKQAKLWLDRYEIDPGEAFTPTIESAVREAKLILPVFSENWVQADWCRRELNLFVSTHEDAVVRIVPVFKNEPGREQLPEVMQGRNAREGYRFYTQDETGAVHEFYWRGLQNRTAYLETLKKIAEFIIGRLNPDPAAGSDGVRVAGRTIFLAVAAQELRDARQRLVNDFASAGLRVVPGTDELPDTATECERVVREALAQAEMAVHILGENRGITPGAGREPILDLQLRLSREDGAVRALPRVLWVPRWVPGRGPNKRDPFEVVGRFGGLQSGEEIYGEEVTDLSLWLRKRLQPASPSDRTHAPLCPSELVVASAAQDDDDLVTDLANLLQGVGARVKPVLAGETLSESVETAFMLIVWGKADRPALDALLGRIPPGARVTCLRLPGGDEIAKRRFFREGVYVEKIDGLPADRQGARGLLERLEIAVPAASAPR